MIPPVPPNFGFSLLAIPVWRWEEAADPAAACNPTAAPQDPLAANAEPQMRRVFVGYEWLPSIQWSLFPDAPWDRGFEESVDEIRDGSRRHEREQQSHEQQQRSAAARPGSGPAPLADDASS